MNIDATLFFDLLLLLLHINSDRSHLLANQLFDLFENHAQNVSVKNINHIKLYIEICKELINYKLIIDENKSEIVNLVIKHMSSPVYKREKVIKENLLSLLDSTVKPERLSTIMDRLNNVVIWYQSNEYIGKLYGNLHECKLTYNIEEQADKILEIKDLVGEFKDTLVEIDSAIGRNGPIEIIDFSKKSSLASAIETYNDNAVKGVIKTGLQGLNKLLGDAGGFAVGITAIFAALQHNFKSGILMYIMRWIAEYNPPDKMDPKRNLILFITLENVGYMNLMKMFEHMYVNLTGNDPTKLNNDEIVEIIYEYFEKLGYTLVIERYLPSAFGYDEYVRVYEKYISAGYKIKAVIVDYIEKMKKNGSGSKVGNHILIQELMNSLVNYNKAVDSNLFSAAQLNREAAVIAGSGIKTPVRNFSERHLAGAIDIGREVDFLAYQHISINEQGESYLTWKWGKHRYVDGTPEKDKFCGYKFHDKYRGIPDDLGKQATYTRDIYATKKKGAISSSDLEALLGIS